MTIMEKQFKKYTIIPPTTLTATTPQVEKTRLYMLAHINARTATSARVDTATWMNIFAYLLLHAHTHRQMQKMQVVDTYKEQKDLYVVSAMFVYMCSHVHGA